MQDACVRVKIKTNYTRINLFIGGNVIHILQNLSASRFIWFCLLILGIVLECCGLYFQYSLRLPPCVNCVYERALYLTFIAAGFIGFLAPNFFLTRFLAIITFFSGSIGGIYVAYHHLKDYYSDDLFGASCSLKANFPDFLPLDTYFPWMFTAQDGCHPLDWAFLGLSMPQWIFASFACGAFVAFLFLFAQFFKHKRRDYIDLYK